LFLALHRALLVSTGYIGAILPPSSNFIVAFFAILRARNLKHMQRREDAESGIARLTFYQPHRAQAQNTCIFAVVSI
jgi:hypothetical protein